MFAFYGFYFFFGFFFFCFFLWLLFLCFLMVSIFLWFLFLWFLFFFLGYIFVFFFMVSIFVFLNGFCFYFCVFYGFYFCGSIVVQYLYHKPWLNLHIAIIHQLSIYVNHHFLLVKSLFFVALGALQIWHNNYVPWHIWAKIPRFVGSHGKASLNTHWTPLDSGNLT